MEKLKDKVWHQLPASEVTQLLDVNLSTGLSAEEVRRRQKESGPNRVTARRGTPAGSRWKVVFTCDGLGRLKVKQPYTWDAIYGWYAGTATRCVYDGRRVIQERTVGNTPVVAYGRGPDLSGTF